jgi:hypothetical protein
MLLIGGIFKLAFGKNVAALGSIWLEPPLAHNLSLFCAITN